MRVTWMIAGLALASTLAACGDAPSRTERSSPAMSTADGNEACLNSAQKGLVGKPFDQSRPLLRGVVTPMRAAMLALVAVGAAAGAILNYAQDPVVSGADRRASNIATPTDQIDPEVTRFIGTPLDLIGTMAREAGQ